MGVTELLVRSYLSCCWFLWFVSFVQSYLLPNIVLQQPTTNLFAVSDGNKHCLSRNATFHSDQERRQQGELRTLGYTLEQLQEARSRRQIAANELQRQLKDANLSPLERQYLQSAYRYQYGKHPFVCRRCWSYAAICQCNSIHQKLSIPFDHIIVWTHPEEWGSPTNTGSLLPLLLESTDIWMRGYHDQQMQELLSSSSNNIVLLWPQPDADNGELEKDHEQDKNISCDCGFLWSAKDGSRTSLEWQLGDDKGSTKHVLIAFEGTWRQARRLLSKFDTSIPRLALRPGNQGITSQSLIAPLRFHESRQSLCTAQAVVEACRCWENHCSPDQTTHWNSALGSIRQKVEATCLYQGKVERQAD